MAVDNKTLQIREVLQEKIEAEYAQIYQTNMAEDMPSVDWRNDKVNIISLFSGCGGLDLGFELAGLSVAVGEEQAIKAFHSKEDFYSIRDQSIFHTIYTIDSFKEANQTYTWNFPTTCQQTSDIRKVLHFPKADLVIGGFPCTGFSEAGPRLIDDERNFLYIHFIRCITQAEPDVFVAENVKGMMTLGKGEVIKQITEDFAACGYDVQYKLLASQDYGVPQLRERVFIVGVKKGLGFKYKYPKPTLK